MVAARWFKILLLSLFVLSPSAALAQSYDDDGFYEAEQQQDQQQQQSPPLPRPQQNYTQPQIDQLVAPVALYPDTLIGDVLMASTYPLEVVQADRWRKDSSNADLNGDQLAAALAQQPWDPSVKSLTAFPQVLSMMDGNLQWTEQLGDAFLVQQPDVMDSVQRLRQQAQASGHLASTPQQTVTTDQGGIDIVPTNPQVVFVPTYNPNVVYGTWEYDEYPPYYFPPPPGYVAVTSGLIGFGAGITVVDWFWGWDQWDWRHHRIDIDNRRFEFLNRDHAPPSSGVWTHDVSHRHGVPYQSVAAQQKFDTSGAQSRRDFRGFSATNGQQPARPPPPAAVNTEPVVSAHTNDAEVPQALQQREQHQELHVEHRSVPQTNNNNNNNNNYAPYFESFSRRSDVSTQSERGAFSRSSTPSPQAAPEAHPVIQAQPVRQPQVRQPQHVEHREAPVQQQQQQQSIIHRIPPPGPPPAQNPGNSTRGPAPSSFSTGNPRANFTHDGD